MNGLKKLIQKYEDFERPNVAAKHAIWEVHSVKVMGFFIGLLVASVFLVYFLSHGSTGQLDSLSLVGIREL